MPNPQPSSGSDRIEEDQRVLILGGTGFVGESLCRQLVECAHPVMRTTVATRSLKAASHLAGLPRLEVAELDPFDTVRLARLVRRHDVVVNLVAILHGDAANFRRVHVELVETLAEVCRSAGKRVVHVSALGVGDDAPSLYLRSKTEGESRLRRADAGATILRPSVIFGENDRFLNLFARLLRFAPALPLASPHALFQPVWVEDVASAIVECVRSESSGRTYECAGPTVYELIDLVKIAGRIARHPRWVLPLPSLLGRMQASILERLPGATLMSCDNLDSMKKPNVASGLPGLRDLGIVASSLEEIAPRYLANGR